MSFKGNNRCMSQKDLVLLALISLKKHKLRSFLTLLGIIIGLITIVVVVGSIAGLNQLVSTELSSYSPDSYVIRKIGIVVGRKQYFDALKRPPLTLHDFDRLKVATLPNTLNVAASAETLADLRHGKRIRRRISVVGVTAHYNKIFPLNPASGDFINQIEEMVGLRVAVIGEDTRAALFPANDPINKTILIRGLSFRVVGVLAKQGIGLNIGLPNDSRVYIPMSVYKQCFYRKTDGVEIGVKARGGPENVQASQDEIRVFMRSLRHTKFKAPDPFGLISQEAVLDIYNQVTSTAFLVMVLVSGISLTVGGVVIMNIMLVSVAERTQEIGQRRAIGARQRDIRKQFLLEAIILSVLGGVIGIFAGGVVILVVRLVADFPASLTPTIVIGGLAISSLVGITAGYLPARRASNMRVIDALRSE